MFRISTLLLVTSVAVVRSITENDKLNEYNAKRTTPTTVLEIGPNNVHPDLFTNSHAVNCAKKRLTYNWRRATADEDIRTLEDIKAGDDVKTHVTKDEYIMTGVEGEVWSVGKKDEFLKLYSDIDPSIDTATEGTCKPKPDVRRAILLKHKVIVHTVWSGAQEAQPGYYLVQYTKGDLTNYGPVEPGLFGQTYDILSSDSAHKLHRNELNWEEEELSDMEYEEYLDELIDEYELEMQELRDLRYMMKQQRQRGGRRHGRYN